MKDYTVELGFWKRLESFISDVQTGCAMGEEEKEMILHNCKLKILHLQNVSNTEGKFCGCGTLPNELDVNGECITCGKKLNPQNYC